MCAVFFFKQKTAYEMRISDWSSDVCSSDLELVQPGRPLAPGQIPDSNGVMLAAMLVGEVAAVQPHHLPDDRAKLASALKELARRHDVIEIGRASCRERVCQYV